MLSMVLYKIRVRIRSVVRDKQTPSLNRKRKNRCERGIQNLRFSTEENFGPDFTERKAVKF